MSSTCVLLVPHVTELDDLRRAIECGFILNPQVEGLGDVEELQVAARSDYRPMPNLSERRRNVQPVFKNGKLHTL